MSLDPMRRRIRILSMLGAGVFGLMGFRLATLAENEALAAGALDQRLSPERIAPRRGRVLDRDGEVLADSDAERTRRYPHAARLPHLLGTLSAAHQGDLVQPGTWLLPGDLVGRSGIERRHEDELRGTPGVAYTVVDEHGQPVQGDGAWTERLAQQARQRWIPASPGADISLTLDADIQLAAERALSGRTGAAVALRVSDGAVLAYASAPSWDPSQLADGADPSDWMQLGTSGARTDRVARSLYEPGRAFELVTAASALDNGIPPHAERPCRFRERKQRGPRWRRRPRSWLPPIEERAHCWADGAHGRVDLHEAIVDGCEAWFRATARDLGPELVAQTARDLGLGAPTGFDPTEAAGLVPDPDWLRRHHQRRWSDGDSELAGLGRGTTLATPLQLAVLAATVANGGERVVPWITGEAPPTQPSGLEPDVLDEVRGAMIAATAKPGNVPLTVSYAGRLSDLHALPELPEASPTQLFVGFAPADDPVVAVAVVLEDGPGAQPTAASVITAWAAADAVLFGAPEEHP